MGREGPVVAVVAAGGAAGALARYGVGLVAPTAPGSFPLGTFLVNVTGCLLIGVLVGVLTERTRAHPRVRPFLVTGVLGGFTTFSTYATDVHAMARAGEFAIAGTYLFGTLAAAVCATSVGMRLARAVGPGAAS